MTDISAADKVCCAKLVIKFIKANIRIIKIIGESLNIGFMSDVKVAEIPVSPPVIKPENGIMNATKKNGSHAIPTLAQSLKSKSGFPSEFLINGIKQHIPNAIPNVPNLTEKMLFSILPLGKICVQSSMAIISTMTVKAFF